MKVRLLPVLLTFFISAAALFGGWFAYQSLAVKNPVGDIVAGIPGVADASVESNGGGLLVRVRLDAGSELSAVYHKIVQAAQKQAGNRNVTIELENESSEALNRIWHTVLFDVAEAMDTRNYSNIPQRLDALEREQEGLAAAAAMDETNVYITLSLEGKTKHIVLPRVPAGMGVWPNEPIQ